MTRVNTQQLKIPEDMQTGWQTVVNLLAEIVMVPSAMIMRIHPQHLEVFTSSQSEDNPYQVGDQAQLGKGLYCEEVIKAQAPILIPNALKDSKWLDTIAIERGMISYCGLPITWPNGEVFGTICILDFKENHYTLLYRQLLDSFRLSVQSQLTTLYQSAHLAAVNRELKCRVDNRAKDLANLNFSLNQEINKRKAAEEQVYYQVTHDIDTGFLNRKALESELQNLLSEKAKDVVVFHIGFTNGRQVQTKYGYSAFDELLLRYHDSIKGLKVLNTITARPTSIDLIIALSTTNINATIDELCHQFIEAGHLEFDIEEHKAHLHTFIGIATSKDHQSPTTLLQYAREAMMACKDSGQEYSLFSQSLADNQTQLNQMESYLLQAVRNDELMLYYQPKVCPITQRWIGAEALLRWKHPILGHISDETLIHLAEQNGLIFEVGNFVLRTAIEKAREWADINEDFRMAINISGVQLQNPYLVEQIQHLLETYHLPAYLLEIEVTESSIIVDETLAEKTLTALHDLGVTLSLDDFGTGYASFSYLKKYPFDYIKIDKSFIQHMHINPKDREIIHSIVQMAKKLNIKIIAEGVENKKHADFILEENCDVSQGYFYGKPMPCYQFELFLIQQKPQSNVSYTYQC
ncbi:diguanylate cyclase [Vibrio sp. 10N.286.49.B3]|uniref:sensor domain-containing phosphodiesterase n=1 Tax=Vibrio sp. 10N.286.49.B3 TaxID=1880855 RepID=UPI000C85D7BC|nr:GGDEF and EAL domain-containing protein [Vibrio sp. 10N.286.49.B3]PMH41421.1 diguanylate cyclase [Vibrio sp. 10N.286.49.B3]